MIVTHFIEVGLIPINKKVVQFGPYPIERIEQGEYYRFGQYGIIPIAVFKIKDMAYNRALDELKPQAS